MAALARECDAVAAAGAQVRTAARRWSAASADPTSSPGEQRRRSSHVGGDCLAVVEIWLCGEGGWHAAYGSFAKPE